MRLLSSTSLLLSGMLRLIALSLLYFVVLSLSFAPSLLYLVVLCLSFFLPLSLILCSALSPFLSPYPQTCGPSCSSVSSGGNHGAMPFNTGSWKIQCINSLRPREQGDEKILLDHLLLKTKLKFLGPRFSLSFCRSAPKKVLEQLWMPEHHHKHTLKHS